MSSQIPIQNLYYLLLYAWDVPEQYEKVRVNAEQCHSLPNLFVQLLIGATERLLRQGLTQEYRYKQETVEGLRGKLCIGETLKYGKIPQGKTICEIDELTHDVLLNQIVFTTLEKTAHMAGVEVNNKERVQKLLRRFPTTSRISLTKEVFGRVRIHRNNRFYRFVLHLCQLLHQSLLPKEGTKGVYEFIDITHDERKMNLLFERFLMNFCKQHCRTEFPEIGRSNIEFQLSPYGMVFSQDVGQSTRLLPIMQTDVTLYNPTTGRKTILDAKYYQQTLVSRFGQQGKIRREHLSQILSYVLNQEKPDDPQSLQTEGILIYPTITEDYDIAYRYRHTDHIIRISTINLNQDWQKIEERLKDIVVRKIEFVE
ncbi:MAG: hypothetical protein MJZ54_02325 [Bacteroidaceae bacterium]|nr:hypothetical protein [Bacteroidaceae bacterium]